MASQPPTSQPPPPLTSSPYPYAAAPDIIRAHQKDVYFQGVLTNQLADLHRRLRGARSAHAWATETRTFADALYLCLTTLIGNRTLGEEYCDLVQVEAPPEPSPPPSFFDGPSTPPPQFPEETPGGPLLPSIQRRAGYIATSILAPYLAGRILPKFRSAARKRLQSRLASLTRQGKDEIGKTGQLTTEYRLLRYLLSHLSTLTNTAHLHAVTLAVFYFTGAYYSLSKRLFGLRYVFTKRIDESPTAAGGGRAGYEVLGVLLVVQMVVRSYIHLRQQLSSSSSPHHLHSTDADSDEEDEYLAERDRAGTYSEINVSLDENAYATNTELLSGSGAPSNQRSFTEIGKTVHTPVLKNGRARYDLALSTKMMGWIKGSQQRKCTLCLEEMKDPAATSCGHVFCWSCIGDWVREKPECPLCRREALVQHILPLRVA
ncbi:Pex12 amino terminal region-domain-containing protein [Podospora australis]|uniref:RING-type E3 ubiquitin transferase n=1 Tax=Podospora australis TaxID=1536484 RepID=A0AAN6WP29_9PEZI|nr:Pex12 amino terminal region-domain-containing protein [Podospora australis]